MPEIKEYFSRADLDSVKRVIQEAEKYTSGEIRVKIINKFDSDISDLRQQAEREFLGEGLHNTRDKTGVLVLVVLRERRFIILGDSGIYSKLTQGYWDKLASRMSLAFRSGNYSSGICRVVEEVGRALSTLFPRRDDDTNELSDDVVVGGGR